MIEKINSLLKECGIEVYKIAEEKVSSLELFFIKKNLDFHRRKDVLNYKVTVYKDFEEDGFKYRGSSSIDIYPTMNNEEIKQMLKEAVYAAGFVKNKYYPIPNGEKISTKILESKFNNLNLTDSILKLKEALYKSDVNKDGGINSSELFLNKIYRRIVNSNGVDVSYETYSSNIELVTDWKGKEDVEIYNYMSFSDLDEEIIENSVKESIELVKQRADAKGETPTGKLKVILSGEPVKTVFEYYINNSNAAEVYNNTANLKLNEKVQGNEVKGDIINITLTKALKNSNKSAPYDEDGVCLKDVKIIENGVLQRYHGDFRHCYYLGIEPTGKVGNVEVEPGSKALCDMLKDEYIHIAAFSDFQIDSLTGNFGGEIRLGWYHDGNTTKTITGGSISGNIKELQKNMFLSQELQLRNNFHGPKALEINGVTVSGR